MKKITFSLFAAFLAVCLNGNAQTIVDIGIDWDGSAIVEDTPVYDWSELGLSPGGSVGTAVNATLGSDSKQIIIRSGVAIRYRAANAQPTYTADVQVAYAELTGSADNSSYIEYSLPETTQNKITAIKVNGISSKEGATSGVNILYSDKATFDENNIIGYASVTLGALQVGNTGYSETTIPAGCKSFRIYKHTKNNYIYLKLDEGTNIYVVSDNTNYDVSLRGPDSNTARITYMSATLTDDVTTSNASIEAEEKSIASVEYFGVTGKKVSEDSKGFIIKKINYVDGTSNTEKRMNR